MQSHVNRDRLVVPVAAIVALGLVSVPYSQGPAASLPKLTEVAAVRLQAEVTTLVSGVAGSLAAEQPVTGTAPAAAAVSPAAASPAAGRTFTYNPNYTWLDNLVANLPDNIRYAILPPLYVVAAVLGTVIGIAQLVIAPIVRLINPNSTFPFPSAAVTAPAVRAKRNAAAASSSAPGDIPPAPGEVTPAVKDAPVKPSGSAGAPKVAGALAAARSRARARILAAVPAVAPSPAPAAPVAETPAPVVTIPAEVPTADPTPAPGAAVGTDSAPVDRTPRAGRGRATVSADSAPASRRAKHSAR